MAVVEAIQSELARFAERKPGIDGSTLAVAALELAAGLDGDNSLTSKTMAAKELREHMAALEASLPPEEKKSKLTELRERTRGNPGRSTNAGGLSTTKPAVVTT